MEMARCGTWKSECGLTSVIDDRYLDLNSDAATQVLQ